MAEHYPPTTTPSAYQRGQADERARILAIIEARLTEVEELGAEWPGWTVGRQARRDLLRGIVSQLADPEGSTDA